MKLEIVNLCKSYNDKEVLKNINSYDIASSYLLENLRQTKNPYHCRMYSMHRPLP